MRRFAICIAACLVALPAVAQDRGVGPRIKLPIPINRPGEANPAGAETEGALGKLLSKPFQELANVVSGDIDAAITLSTSIPSLQDGNGQQCWMALKQFGAVVKAHPVPLTGRAVTDLEAARLMAMAANKLCADPHCTQVFADLANAVQHVSIASQIPVPSLNSLCSQVPVVVVAPPVPAPPPANPPPSAPPAQP